MKLLNAAETREIIFCSGAQLKELTLLLRVTEESSLKRATRSSSRQWNIIEASTAWQLLCEQTGAVLRVIPMNDDGELLIDEYRELLNKKTKFVSIVYLSNSLGTINPIKQIIKRAHEFGIPVCSLTEPSGLLILRSMFREPTMPDFYAFSGHKVCGPTGIGVLYGKGHLLESMPPYQGGDMISSSDV